MTTETTPSARSGNAVRLVIIGALVIGAFFGAYRFAVARSAGSASADAVAQTGLTPASDAAATDPSAAGGAACACCGSSAPTEGGLTGDKVEGTAVVEGDVQKIDVDLSKGYYEPNQLVLKAGVPTEITFGQSSGCTAQVMSNELGFFEDLSAGPVTVELPALEKGEYPFYCGMQMVFGKIIVQ
jgi:hypothetical protein